MKAKKIQTIYGKYSTIITYEYRGKTYDVEYARDWTYCTSPARIQHQDAQARIDREIELASRPQKPYRYEDTAQAGLDLFWEYVNQ